MHAPQAYDYGEISQRDDTTTFAALTNPSMDFENVTLS